MTDVSPLKRVNGALGKVLSAQISDDCWGKVMSHFRTMSSRTQGRVGRIHFHAVWTLQTARVKPRMCPKKCSETMMQLFPSSSAVRWSFLGGTPGSVDHCCPAILPRFPRAALWSSPWRCWEWSKWTQAAAVAPLRCLLHFPSGHPQASKPGSSRSRPTPWTPSDPSTCEWTYDPWPAIALFQLLSLFSSFSFKYL